MVAKISFLSENSIYKWEYIRHVGFVIQRHQQTVSDYKSDSFITPDYKSGVTSVTNSASLRLCVRFLSQPIIIILVNGRGETMEISGFFYILQPLTL